MQLLRAAWSQKHVLTSHTPALCASKWQQTSLPSVFRFMGHALPPVAGREPAAASDAPLLPRLKGQPLRATPLDEGAPSPAALPGAETVGVAAAAPNGKGHVPAAPWLGVAPPALKKLRRLPAMGGWGGRAEVVTPAARPRCCCVVNCSSPRCVDGLRAALQGNPMQHSDSVRARGWKLSLSFSQLFCAVTCLLQCQDD